jgi:hypothetical protein
VSLQPRGGVLLPNHYAWYILASSLDVIVTHAIIYHLGGEEANKIADHLLQRFGLWGLVGLKYATVIVVIAVCEWVGRKHPRTARRLAVTAIIISAMPVGAGLVQVMVWTHWGSGETGRVDSARAEQRLERLAEDEVVLGELGARHVLVDVAEHEVDAADLAGRPGRGVVDELDRALG